MVPIETLTRWAAFVGAILLLKRFHLSKAWVKNWKTLLKPTLAAALAMTLLANSLVFLHSLRADLWKERGTYREVGYHIKEVPETCGIITSRETPSISLPFQRGDTFPEPAVAVIQSGIEKPGFRETQNSPLDWREHLPHCQPGDQVLLHLAKPEIEWIQNGCVLLDSGLLRFLPKKTWEWALHHRWVAGPWYRCPTTVLSHFGPQNVKRLFSRSMGKFEKLPPLGITAEELETLGLRTSPPPADTYLPSLERPATQ